MSQTVRIAVAIAHLWCREVWIPPGSSPKENTSGPNVVCDHCTSEAATALIEKLDNIAAFNPSGRRIFGIDQNRFPTFDFLAATEIAIVQLGMQTCFWLARQERQRMILRFCIDGVAHWEPGGMAWAVR